MKTNPQETKHREFDAKRFWRHYVATVDTGEDWTQEQQPQKGRGSNRLFLFLLLFHVFLIGSVVLFNLVAERPKPVFVDNSAPQKAAQNPSRKSPVVEKHTPLAPSPAGSGKDEALEHRVGNGDTLKSIAGTYGTTEEIIAKLNEIDVNTTLAVGSVLRVPKPAANPVAPTPSPAVQPAVVRETSVAAKVTAPPAPPPVAPAKVEPKAAPPKPEVVTPPKPPVVASKPPEDKPKAPVADSPPPAKTKPTEAKALVKPEPPKPPPAAPPATAKPALATTTHTVKPGETFYSISRRHGVKAEDIMRLNGFTDPGKLREGTVLKVPGKP